MLQLILETKADPNDSREGWGTALQIATFKGNESIVKPLLEASTDVNLHCEVEFDGVRDPRKPIKFKVSANQLRYIDEVHYSPASGSVGTK